MAGDRSRSVRRAGKGLVIIAIIALAGALGFAALGVWQIERLLWKTELMAAVEVRATAAPVDPFADGAWPQFDADRDEYRRVAVTGQFDPNKETLVQALTARGGGFWVMTPFWLNEQQSVLVNRGFIPPDRRPRDTREPPPSGDVTISGLMRQSEPGGGFLRSNDSIGDRWFSRDVAAIASHQDLPQAASFFIDEDRGTRDYPIGGLTVLRFSNNHLVYALTWFSLSLMLIGALAYTLWDRRRARPEDQDLDGAAPS